MSVIIDGERIFNEVVSYKWACWYEGHVADPYGPSGQFGRGASSVMVIVLGNGHSDPSSILDESICIFYNANNNGKGTIYQPLRSGRIWHKVNF